MKERKYRIRLPEFERGVLLDSLIRVVAEKEGITEQLKIHNQKEWVQRMNAVYNAAREIVRTEVIYNAIYHKYAHAVASILYAFRYSLTFQSCHQCLT